MSENDLCVARLLREDEHTSSTLKWEQAKKNDRSKNPPRKKGAVVQSYMCSCYLQQSNLDPDGGNCAECRSRKKAIPVADPNGRSGAMILGCEICVCDCSTGPFKDSERQDIARARYSAKLVNRTKTGPASMQSTLNTLSSMITTGVKKGMLDLSYNNTEVGIDSMQGAIAGNLSRMQFPEDAEQNFFRQAIGPCSDRFPDNKHWRDFETNAKKGDRHRRNGLDKSGQHMTKNVICLDSSSSESDTVSLLL